MSQYRAHSSQPPPNQPGQGPSQTNYQNRYQRNGAWFRGWNDKLFDAGPVIVGLFGWAIALGCLLALESMDIIVGQITAKYMTGGKYEWLYSAATTGLAIAMLGFGFYGWRQRWKWWLYMPILALAMIPVSIDILNDAMSVDILRFGHFIDTSIEYQGDWIGGLMHNLYRIMMGAMSALGEPIVAASVVVFPLMKELLRSGSR